MENVQNGDHCSPSEPAPTPQEQEWCEGTIKMECCCPRLHTRSFLLNIGPQSEASLLAFGQGTVNSYESNGYLVLGHSITDTGAGWVFGLTIGFYAP